MYDSLHYQYSHFKENNAPYMKKKVQREETRLDIIWARKALQIDMTTYFDNMERKYRGKSIHLTAFYRIESPPLA